MPQVVAADTGSWEQKMASVLEEMDQDLGRSERQLLIENAPMRVTVEGVSNDRQWTCALEFGYANEESLYCRPFAIGLGPPTQAPAIPTEASTVHMAFLAPMSGLAATWSRAPEE